MLSIFNMHIQLAWGGNIYSSLILLVHLILHRSSPFSLPSKTFLAYHKCSYTNVQSLLQTCCVYLLLTHNLKSMASDQNANSEHGSPCSVKKKQSKHHILIGGRGIGGGEGLTKSISLQLIMHCINSLCYLV